MKRLLAVLLTCALVVGMAPVALAAADGLEGPYALDSDGKIDTGSIIDEIVPGESMFFLVTDGGSAMTTKPSGSMVRRFTENASLAGTARLIQKKESSGNTFYWFIELPTRANTSTLRDDLKNLLAGTIGVGNAEEYFSIYVQFPAAGSLNVSKDKEIFDMNNLASSREEELRFDEWGDSYFVFDGTRESKNILISADNDFNNAVATKYNSLNANFDFYNGYSGGTFNSNGTMYIEGADSGKYLYKIVGGTLEKMNYSRSGGYFVFTTRQIESYVVSDKEVTNAAGTGTASGSTGASSSSSTSSSSSQSSGTVSTGTLASIIANNFSNKFAVAAYGNTYEPIGSTIWLRTKLNVDGMNTGTLRVYAYDQANNRLLVLSDAGAYLGTDGFIYFKSNVKGQYVFTDSVLTK